MAQNRAMMKLKCSKFGSERRNLKGNKREDQQFWPPRC